MIGGVSLETLLKNIMVQDIINLETVLNTTESTNTNVFKIMHHTDNSPTGNSDYQ